MLEQVRESAWGNSHSLTCSSKLAVSDCTSVRWIGKDAVRELTAEKIVARVK